MNTPNVHAGRLERRVRRVGRETMPGIHGFCSLPLSFIRRITSLYPPYGLFFTLGAIRGVPLLRLTAFAFISQGSVFKKIAQLQAGRFF